MTRTFYRIVKGNPPTRDDFLSNAATYPDAHVPDDLAHLWGGVSLFDTREATARLVRVLPALGVAVAQLDLPDDPSQAGPFTLLADAVDGKTGPEPAFYELWETRTGNLLASYDDADGALATVREMIALNGPAAVATWAMLERDGTNDALVAAGDELAARAARDMTRGNA